MMALYILLIALWLWWCLVMSEGRPMIVAIFMVPLLILLVLRLFFEWAFDELVEFNKSLGDW